MSDHYKLVYLTSGHYDAKPSELLSPSNESFFIT